MLKSHIPHIQEVVMWTKVNVVGITRTLRLDEDRFLRQFDLLNNRVFKFQNKFQKMKILKFQKNQREKRKIQILNLLFVQEIKLKTMYRKYLT